MNDKSIDVHFEDINKKYYTIDEVANILNIEQSTIAYYFEKLNDFLNITSVGMYQLFDNTDIENLKKIKDLEQVNNMSMNEIRKFLTQNKQEVLLRKESNNKVDQSVLNIFQTFANAMIEQNNKIEKMYNTNVQLTETINIISNNQKDIKQELQEQRGIHQELLKEYKEKTNEQSTQLILIQKELSITKEENKKVSQKLYKQEKNTQTNFNNISQKIDEDITLVKNLREKAENNKVKAQEKEIEELKRQLENKHQGLFGNISKIFYKKN
jgi:DNA-binding transcriptional MerR regulator